MRMFISQSGKVEILCCSHRVFCVLILKTTLFKYLNSNVRVLVYNNAMGIETKQDNLTSTQKSIVRRLYRQHRCYDFSANINNKEVVNIRNL